MGEHPSADAPDAWATSEDPLAAGGDAPAWGEAEPPAQAWSDLPEGSAVPAAEPGHVVSPPTDKFALASAAAAEAEAPASTEAEAEPAAVETEAPPEWGEALAEEAPPAAETPASTGEFAAPGDGVEPPAEAPADQAFAEQGELKLQGWVAPPAEPEPQGAGWFGQALEATTPLAAKDLGTLASLGVDPNDGVGALRLLAALARVLQRHQLLDPDEVANEIRESRTQAAAERAAAESEASSAAASGESEASAEEAPPGEPAET